MPTPSNRVIDIVVAAQTAMLKAFNPTDAIQPPLGGGSEMCRVIIGAAVALELWDAHAVGTNCKEPFMWVRLHRRFHSQQFPAPVIDTTTCTLPEVVELEIGIGRCSKVSEVIDWKNQALEGAVALDDSWRMSLAACLFRDILSTQDVGIGTTNPFGPEGGVVGWITTLFAAI
jgi:hypothetical protein